MTPDLLKQWQLEHYQRRLAEETRFEARIWLRNELFNLKKVQS